MDPSEFNAASDPFETLGLEPRFDLARSDIERAYLAKAAQTHPDLDSSDDAPDLSAALNAARACLIDPERRAHALLHRLGGANVRQDQSLPPGFLNDIMANRIEIEEAIESGDAKAVAQWRDWAFQQRASFIEAAGLAFLGGRDRPWDVDLCTGMRRLLNAWRYIERLIEQLPDA